MPQVVVSIDSKTYRMACGDGEEAHLVSLAAQIDARIAGLRSSFGEIGDLRLTVMAAMTIADELFEAKRAVEALSAGSQSADAREAALDASTRRERALMTAQIVEVAEALEEMERRLRPGGGGAKP